MVFNLEEDGSYGDVVLRGVAGLKTGGADTALVVFWCQTTQSCHTAQAGIAAAYRLNHWRLWNTGSSAFADDDGRRLVMTAGGRAAAAKRVSEITLHPRVPASARRRTRAQHCFVTRSRIVL